MGLLPKLVTCICPDERGVGPLVTGNPVTAVVGTEIDSLLSYETWDRTRSPERFRVSQSTGRQESLVRINSFNGSSAPAKALAGAKLQVCDNKKCMSCFSLVHCVPAAHLPMCVDITQQDAFCILAQMQLLCASQHFSNSACMVGLSQHHRAVASSLVPGPQWAPCEPGTRLLAIAL